MILSKCYFTRLSFQIYTWYSFSMLKWDLVLADIYSYTVSSIYTDTSYRLVLQTKISCLEHPENT